MKNKSVPPFVLNLWTTLEIDKIRAKYLKDNYIFYGYFNSTKDSEISSKEMGKGFLASVSLQFLINLIYNELVGIFNEISLVKHYFWTSCILNVGQKCCHLPRTMIE